MFRFKPEEKYNIELQSPSKSLWSTFKKAYILDKNFKKFWKKLDKKNLCKDLVGVTDNFINSESYNLVSRFWCHCQINHYKSISSTSTSEAVEKNIRDYARHVLFTKKDFNEILNLLKNEKIEKVDLLKKHKNLDKFDSIQYNLATLVLFLISKNYNQNMYEKINKQIYEKFSPTLGIGNQIYNQHLLFSLLELEKIEKLINISQNNLNILEFGAGYGRTANLFLSLAKNLKYVVVDIPPAISISHNELKRIYKDKKFYLAIDVKSKDEMSNIIDKNDVIFIFPHQLKYLNKNFFDISIMIGITLEMDPKIVKKYMSYVNILSKSLYMKVFKYAGLPFSFYKFYKFDEKEHYFIDKNWVEIFCQLGLETDNIAHLGYKIKND
jgi:putative sugar O-methyltransferase|tara:strand:+ start:296 stop:1441 length:1146 start_codon:yes stop_codon:yes gene_type:complete